MGQPLIGIAGILVLGIFAQWLAWRLKLPAILLLLVCGFLAGPVTGFINPDALFGDALFPVVSISVALILFEGALSLKLSELRTTGAVVRRLLSVGALSTWFLVTLSAVYILGMDLPMGVLLGAILTVTGPTVITPLLRHVRPAGKVSSVLNWEGMLVDPIGAILAVLVYEAILADRFHEVPYMAILGILETVLLGVVAGGLGAIVMIVLLKYYWIPDFLKNPVTLMTVLVVFTVSNLVQPESGLLSVTFMGLVLSNQWFVTVKHIIEFKENLRVLLISGLFILLAARIRVEDIGQLGILSVIFLITLIVFVRPISVFLSTVGSELKWKERAFIAAVAPRGIVAAAVASVFAFRLTEAGVPGAAELAPMVFLVITGTVVIYSFGATSIAKRLSLARSNPQGVLMVGAQPWAVTIAQAIKDAGYDVLMMDTNLNNVFAARMAGLPTHYGSGLTESIFQEIGLEGIGRLMAVTPNNGVNSLAVLHFNDAFDSSELYQLVPKGEEGASKDAVSKHLHGRYLFGADATYDYLNQRFFSGAVIKKTLLTEEFDYAAFKARYGSGAFPLFLIKENGELQVFTADKTPEPAPGSTLISIVDPVEDEGGVAGGAGGRKNGKPVST